MRNFAKELERLRALLQEKKEPHDAAMQAIELAYKKRAWLRICLVIDNTIRDVPAQRVELRDMLLRLYDQAEFEIEHTREDPCEHA